MNERYVPKLDLPGSKQRMKPVDAKSWIGRSINRVEDSRLLCGTGKYIADISLPRMAHVALLRSPFPHARIVSIDKSEALNLPGVIDVITGSDLKDFVGPSITFSSPAVPQDVIAIDKVRHVGETVAAVIADDRYIAEDALELVYVDYEELPVVNDFDDALNSSSEQLLHPDSFSSNVIYDKEFTFGPVDNDFNSADIVVKRKIRWNRSSPQPLETVGALASYDAGTGKFTVYCNTNMINYVAWLCATSLGVSSTHLNIIPTLSGGSFGSKQLLHKVVILTAAISRIINRPVKFIEDRLDNMTNADSHASDREYEASLALKNDGTVLSLSYDVIDDYGAYFQFGVGSHGNTFSQVTGPYRINSVRAHVVAVLTNKCQQGAYRGFGSEVSNFVLERLMDEAAHVLNIDPVILRQKNLIDKSEFPYIIPTGNVYDSGDYQKVLSNALSMFGYEKWRTYQEEKRKEGRHVGIGVVCCQERSVYSATEFWFLNDLDNPGFELTSSPESVFMKIDPAGNLFIRLNSPFWGNSPETVATQIAADLLTLDPSCIDVSYSDQSTGFDSVGPGGSRYTVMIAGALCTAVAKLKAKLLKVASHMLECDEDQLFLIDGSVCEINGNRKKTISEVAMAAHYFRLSFPDEDNYTSGIQATAVYDHPFTTLPAKDRSHVGSFYPMVGHAVHAVAVEVDPNSGKIDFLDYVAVHDCGTMINPKTVDGQILGATVQGIGTALYEHMRYEDGQLTTASFADYHMPTSMEVPDLIRVGHVETPSPYTEFGVKGSGEGGRMAAPPAIAQAIEDALTPYGVKINEVPLTPQKIFQLINDSESR